MARLISTNLIKLIPRLALHGMQASLIIGQSVQRTKDQ